VGHAIAFMNTADLVFNAFDLATIEQVARSGKGAGDNGRTQPRS
jgi:hypothetical protein